MTQSRTPTGATSEYLDSNQLPQTLTWAKVPNAGNQLANFDYINFDLNDSTSAAEAASRVVRSNGRVYGIIVNTIAATDSTAGWRIKVNNETVSDSLMGDFGFGTKTVAAAANDKTTAATVAGQVVRLENTLADSIGFSAGDNLTVDTTQDSGAGALSGTVILAYDVKAR